MYRLDIVDLEIYGDLDPNDFQGGTDPYIRLFMRDGVGEEHKLLSKGGGWITDWKAEDADETSQAYALKLDGLLERYWFYGIEVPGEQAYGIEVRDNDGVLDDWCMDPPQRYYGTHTGTELLQFAPEGGSQMTVIGTPTGG